MHRPCGESLDSWTPFYHTRERRTNRPRTRRRIDPVKKSLPLSQVYRHLEPGPVVMVTTARNGHANVMTLSWHMMMDFEPPIVAFVVSNRNYSFRALKTTGECVINIPTAELAAKTVRVGNTTGRKIDKFKAFRLTPVAASRVGAPLIDECDARLADQYNVFILRVLKAWIDPSVKNPRTIHHRGRGVFMIAGRTIRLPSRMK